MSSWVDQLKALAKKLVRHCEPIDPTRFGDELALRTEWTPAVRGGASFGTHTLKQVSGQRMVFSATLGTLAFAGVFALSGLAALAGGIVVQVSEGAFNPSQMGASLVLSLPFLGAGLFIGSRTGSPRTFDTQLGSYWKGWRMHASVGSSRVDDSHVPLAEICALQILKEYVQSDKGGYYSYELNLVLADASRINVVDHGDVKRIRREAAMLAAFLDMVPVWDASQ